jgi:hypothetical protein
MLEMLLSLLFRGVVFGKKEVLSEMSLDLFIILYGGYV